MPLPMQLEHINLWVLDDGDGVTLVDTGVNLPDTRELWERILHEHLDGRPVHRVLVTHMHPDHVGCAGWLCRKLDAPLWMTREEYLYCRILVADTGQEAPRAGVNFYRRAGFPDEAIERYTKRFGLFGRVVSRMPRSFRRLHEGERIRIGEHEWEVLVGRGHSPEHACFLCEELGLLISGDQVLPTISSNVSVYPTEPRNDPLHDWLESCRRLRERLPTDVVVLPAHGRPFRGAAERLTELIDEHETGLEKLAALCSEPKRAVDVFPALFKSPIGDSNLMMATGEAVAHLHYLAYRGVLESSLDADGVAWYRRA